MSKSLEELEQLKQRLQTDINRSRQIDQGGLDRHSPLMRNFEQVQRDIAEAKKNG